MGNASCTLGIQTDSETFVAGSKITGRVYLSVTNPRGVKARNLNIQFTGREETNVYYKVQNEHGHSHNHNTHHNHNESRYEHDRRSANVFNSIIKLQTYQGGRIFSGQYEFPFELSLPQNLPSSMTYRCPFKQSHCSIRYEIRAYLTNQENVLSYIPLVGDWINSSSSTRTIDIIGKAANGLFSTASTDPIVNPPDEHAVNRCCCINKGSMNLSSEISSGLLHPGERFQVSFLAANNSTVAAPKGVQITLSERVTFKGHYREATGGNTVLVKSFIPKHTIPDMMETSTTSLEPHLLGGKQHIVNLIMPRSALSSYTSGQLIQVRHELLVRIQTPCCISSPETFNEVTISHHHEQHSANASSNMPPSENMDYFEVTPSAPFLPDHDGPNKPMNIHLPEAVAVALPHDWNPEKADVASVPLVHATLIDDEDSKSLTSSSLPPFQNEYYGASAPAL